MTTRVVTPKDPTEVIIVTFDFATILAGDVISGTPTVACVVDAGIDATPGGMLSGSATQSQGIVSQKVQGGIAPNDYRLTCMVNTVANGRTLALAMILPVRVA